MSDKKNVVVRPGFAEAEVNADRLNVVIYDEYRESRKEQVKYTFTDLEPYMVSHLIEVLSEGLRKQKNKIDERFNRAFQNAVDATADAAR